MKKRNDSEIFRNVRKNKDILPSTCILVLQPADLVCYRPQGHIEMYSIKEGVFH